MLATMLLSGLLFASPDGTISYRKTVMVDPSYTSRWSRERIEQALRRAREPRRPSARVRVVETTYAERRALPRGRWSVGLGHAYPYGGWGVSLGYAHPSSGLAIGLGYGYPGHAWGLSLGYASCWYR